MDTIGVKARSTWYSHISMGILPPPVRVGPRISGWPDTELDAIVAARVAGKDDDAIRELVKQLTAARKNARKRKS